MTENVLHFNTEADFEVYCEENKITQALFDFEVYCEEDKINKAQLEVETITSEGSLCEVSKRTGENTLGKE